MIKKIYHHYILSLLYFISCGKKGDPEYVIQINKAEIKFQMF